MYGILVLAASAALQVAAGIMAFRLIRLTGFRTAWTLIALGMWGVALRRIVGIYVHLSSGDLGHLQHGYELLGLLASALMLAGVVFIEPVFRSVREARDTAVALASDNARQAAELRDAFARVKVLSGLVPVCSGCKKIRDSAGRWHEIESYISEHSNAQFSHGLCPECGERLYPDHYRRS